MAIIKAGLSAYSYKKDFNIQMFRFTKKASTALNKKSRQSKLGVNALYAS
tara:strand:+ start:1488 stop:1637 length:150 start_codon:yes stop_codon:yes gene_type:complete